jgi:hypothetical protein
MTTKSRAGGGPGSDTVPVESSAGESVALTQCQSPTEAHGEVQVQ